MKSIFSITILFFSALICQAQPKIGINFVATSWDETVQNASKSGKQIFVYAQTKSCQFCRKMEKEVFTDPKVIDYYNANFVSYKIDIEDGGAGEEPDILLWRKKGLDKLRQINFAIWQNGRPN